MSYFASTQNSMWRSIYINRKAFLA